MLIATKAQLRVKAGPRNYRMNLRAPRDHFA